MSLSQIRKLVVSYKCIASFNVGVSMNQLTQEIISHYARITEFRRQHNYNYVEHSRGFRMTNGTTYKKQHSHSKLMNANKFDSTL